MLIRPSLGGVLKARDCLTERGFSVSDVSVCVVVDGEESCYRGQQIDILIQQLGPMKRVREAEFADRGRPLVRFVDAWKAVSPMSYSTGDEGPVCGGVLQFAPRNPPLEQYACSKQGREIPNLLVWGKSKPSIIDKFICLFLPRAYRRVVYTVS